MNKALFSCVTDNWETPQDLFERYNDVFHFNTDVCADRYNHKVKHYFDKEQDGLSQRWEGACWMNPPYGRQIGRWVAKAFTEWIENGTTVVCLLPSRTDTRWFQDYILPFAKVEFIRGRLKFGGAKTGAPFPSIIAVFDGALITNALRKEKNT